MKENVRTTPNVIAEGNDGAMASSPKHLVTIKGVKDGLVFQLDDTRELADVLSELAYKLEKTHRKILTGPIIHVNVKLGRRIVTEAESDSIRKVIGKRGNLFIQSIESEPPDDGGAAQAPKLRVHKGIIRSGQTLQHDGDLLLLGDVNPGGTIAAHGHIYIVGSLRGMAHAGADGDEQAVIAASHLRPTQLRIADIISRPPEEWGTAESFMEFAYLEDRHMKIDKITNLHRVRPDVNFEGR